MWNTSNEATNCGVPSKAPKKTYAECDVSLPEDLGNGSPPLSKTAHFICGADDLELLGLAFIAE